MPRIIKKCVQDSGYISGSGFFIVNGVIDYNHNGVYAYVSIVQRISSDDNKYEPYKAPKDKMLSPFNMAIYN